METLNPQATIHRLTQRLKMRHLVLLLRIQQHGSLTRVADFMATSQPAVTKALAELEAMFGAPLFDRSSRGMTATALGRVALKRAEAMLHDLDHLARDMQAVASGHHAHLNVGVTPFLSGNILGTAVRNAVSDPLQPLMLTLHEGSSEYLLQRLRDHSLDVAICRASAAVDIEGLAFEVLLHQQPRLLASRRLAAQLARRQLSWPALRDLQWILGTEGTSVRQQVSNIFLQEGITPPLPVVESDSTMIVGEILVANENAISIMPSDIAAELVRIAGVAIVPYTFYWTLPPIALYTRLEDPQREAGTRFAQALRKAFPGGHQREAGHGR